MQEVRGSIPLGSTNFLTIFGICLNGLRGNRLPPGRWVTVLHAVSGHRRVTRIGLELPQEYRVRAIFHQPFMDILGL